MQSLDLNLASRPFRNNTLLWVGFGLTLLTLLVMTGLNLRSHASHRSELEALQGRVSGIESHRRGLHARAATARREIGTVDVEALAIRAQKANEVIRWKAFSWTLLFNRLEEVQPYDIQMASIQPAFRPQADVSNARNLDQVAGVPVAVDGTARDLRAFFALERALVDSPYFTRVEPERTDTDGQTGETVFRLRFIYDPDVPGGPPPRPEEAELQTEELTVVVPDAPEEGIVPSGTGVAAERRGGRGRPAPPRPADVERAR